jgi:hypothetical protein
MIPSNELLAQASFPQVIDSSILTTYACPTKFFYQYCLNRHPARKSVHLHAGGAFAKGIETVRKAFYLENKPLDQALFDGFRAFTTYWGDYDQTGVSGTGQYKSFENMAMAMFDYFRQYDPRSDHIQPFIKKDGTPAVEFTFAIPLPINHPETGEPILYAGRCDMIGQMKKQVVLVDEKTAYSIATDWSTPFSMRGQFIGYTWAAKEFGIPASACAVRGISIQVKNIKHVEAIIQFPDHAIQSWHKEMLNKIESLITHWKNKDFPMSYGNECGSFGGCSYLDLCKSANPDMWIDTFDTRKWDPLDLSNIKASA